LFLKDKQFVRPGNVGYLFSDLQTVARILGILDNGTVVTVSLFNSVNSARVSTGVAPWKIGDEGNDFEAL
jgi:hypothetical protein